MPPPYSTLSPEDLAEVRSSLGRWECMRPVWSSSCDARAQEAARWRPRLREVVRTDDELASVASAYHGAEVASFVKKKFGQDVQGILGRLTFSQIIEEEAAHIQPAEACTYLPARFHLGDVGFHSAIEQDSRMEEGETYPYVFVVDDAARSKFQACFRIDAQGGAAFSILASSGERFPFCLTPGGADVDIEAARVVAADVEAADSTKWLSSLLTSRHRAAAHLVVDLFDWWYHARGGRVDFRLRESANWDLILVEDFINVRRALMASSTVREVRRVFKALDGDIGCIVEGESSQGRVAGRLPDARLAKRQRFGVRSAAETWRALREKISIDSAEDIDAALDFCLKYVVEYETNARFASAADRLLGSSSADMNANLLAECLRV